MNNVPLVKREEEPQEAAPEARHAADSRTAEERAQDEAEALRNAVRSPLWPILSRRFRLLVTNYEKDANILSNSNPLGNKDAVANAWAYVAVAKEIETLFFRLIEAEAELAEREGAEQ